MEWLYDIGDSFILPSNVINNKIKTNIIDRLTNRICYNVQIYWIISNMNNFAAMVSNTCDSST